MSELTLSLSLCRLEWERCTIFCRKYYQECISSLVRRTSWWKIQCFTKLNNSFDAKEERLHILFIYILLLLSNAGLDTQDPRAWRHAWHGLTWILPWHQSNNINKESRHNFLVFTSHRLCQYQYVLLVLSEGGCVLYDDKSSIYFVVVWRGEVFSNKNYKYKFKRQSILLLSVKVVYWLLFFSGNFDWNPELLLPHTNYLKEMVHCWN